MRGKTLRQICYVNCCEWALKITKIHEALQLSERSVKFQLLPNGVKGEILEDWYKVSQKEVRGLAKQFVVMFYW